MKNFSLRKLLKNNSFVKCMNVALSSIIVANTIGMNTYAINNSTSTFALGDHPNKLTVSRASGMLDYFVSNHIDVNNKNMSFQIYDKRTDGGDVAYCLEHWKTAPDGDKYNKVRVKMDEGMQHIIYSKPGMGSEIEDYYVRQMALNHYQGHITFIEWPGKEGLNYRDKALELSAEAKEVKAGNLVSQNIVANTFKISPVSREFTLDGNYYVTDWFTVSRTGDLKNYTVEVQDAPNGVQVLDKNGTVSSGVLTSTDTKFKLRVPKANIDKGYNNIKINVVAVFNNKELVEYHPDNNDTIQKVLVVRDVEKSISRSVTANIGQPKGSLKIVKVGKNDTRLQGAEFKLEKDGQIVKDNLVSDVNGEIVVNDLDLGTYKIIEKTAPNAYMISPESQAGVDVEIVANTETVQKITNNIIQGRIKVIKKDSEIKSLMLEGAEFVVKDNAGVVVDTLITNNKGEATSKLLDYGVYSLEEVSSPTNYHLDNYVQAVNISENNKTYSYEVENRIFKGDIEIVKVDSQDGNSFIQGAGFDIIAKNVKGVAEGTVVEHVVTDVNGVAKTGKLRCGTYELVETKVPNGFLKPNKTYTVDVLEDGKTYVKRIENDPVLIKVKLIKTDGTTKAPLSGVKFKLVNKDTGKDITFEEVVNGEVAEKVELTTSENGEIIFPKELRFGNYQLVEVAPLEGYLGIAPIDIIVDENISTEYIENVGNVHSIKVDNNRIKGSMLLTKVDMDTKEPIAGVEFEVECVEGFMAGQKFSLITGENGQVSLDNLDFGRYKITEIKTKEEYVLNSEPKFFDIKTDKEVVEITFENKLKEGYLEVEKKDSENKKPLEGVEFTIYDSQDKVVGVYTTDKDGKFKSDKLVYGKYKLKETKVLENYIDSNLEIDFEILNDKEIITKIIENDPMRGILFFKKVDSKTKDVLVGAKMKLVGTDDVNKHIEIEFESSKEGNEFKLPIGNYKITEESPPEGYIKSIIPKKIEIKNGERLELNFENTKKPANLGEVLDKPLTGDYIIVNVISIVVSLIALIVLNKGKFSKRNWEKYKRD